MTYAQAIKALSASLNVDSNGAAVAAELDIRALDARGLDVAKANRLDLLAKSIRMRDGAEGEVSYHTPAVLELLAADQKLLAEKLLAEKAADTAYDNNIAALKKALGKTDERGVYESLAAFAVASGTGAKDRVARLAQALGRKLQADAFDAGNVDDAMVLDDSLVALRDELRRDSGYTPPDPKQIVERLLAENTIDVLALLSGSQVA